MYVPMSVKSSVFLKKFNKLLKRLLERPSEFIDFQHMNYVSLKKIRLGYWHTLSFLTSF